MCIVVLLVFKIKIKIEKLKSALNKKIKINYYIHCTKNKLPGYLKFLF